LRVEILGARASGPHVFTFHSGTQQKQHQGQL
jgi:hypothetical protein